MTNGISINAGFEFGSAQPVDSRLVLTNNEMLHADTNLFPDPYFAINADDRFLYIYSSNNTYSEVTGYFKKYTSDGGKSQWFGTEEEYQALPVETQSDTSIVFYRYGSDSEKNYVVSDHSIKQEVYMSESDYQELETKDSNTVYLTPGHVRKGEDIILENNLLENRLTKDYYFDSKSVQFFGDSIAYGVGVDDDSTDLNLYQRWTTKFCSLVNATEVNNAVSGSLYTRGYNDVASITDTVKNATLSGDFIFMCGGINDWQLGVPLDEFGEAVDECFAYLKANYNGDVVVVAPFNAIKNLVGSPITSIYQYRKILAQKAYEYGFDFINGGKISLAPTRTAGTCIKYQYSDGLHPSGFGHYICGYEMMFQFTGQTWETYSTGAGTIYWSGKYLDGIKTPIWKYTHAQFTMQPATELTNTLLTATFNNTNVILQGYTGCVIYGGNYVAVLPYYNTSASYITDMVFYTDAGGFQCQHKNTLEITNGNIFVTMIRYFDMNHQHAF